MCNAVIALIQVIPEKSLGDRKEERREVSLATLHSYSIKETILLMNI